MSPRIIIPTNFGVSCENGAEQSTLNESYVRLVREAGGIPLLAPPGASFDEREAAGFWGDGLLLTGGADIDPSLFGQARHPKATPLNARRQAAEFAWFAWAEQREWPVLGICLGCQLINVARGGSLIQYLPEVEGTLDHGQGGRDAWHDATVREGLLKEVVGPRLERINSRHRQAVDSLGRGLAVAAESEDGVVEAVVDERPGRFVLGVQWHPEDIGEHPATRAIARAFVEAARRACGARERVEQ